MDEDGAPHCGMMGDVIASWDELIQKVGRRPDMFVGRPRYSLVRSFDGGFGAARGDNVLEGFQHWLSDQPQNDEVKNFGWPSLVLRYLFSRLREYLEL